MQFVAIDVETANPDMASICQVGIAQFSNGKLIDEWSSLVDPEDYFDAVNISIHGITEGMVEGFPAFPDLAEEVRGRLAGSIALCHTPFDRVSVSQVCSKYNIARFECTWLDSARIARRAWPQFARSGYGLRNVCAAIGYEFRCHDALEDAKAAGQILLAAIMETGLDLQGWLKRVEQPIYDSRIATDGNLEGPLYGEVLVFTGALQITRREAAEMAARIGCTVREGITKDTTIIVIGNQDARKLAGHDKSSKHSKAEDLIRKGQAIKILTEKDFEKLVGLGSGTALRSD